MSAIPPNSIASILQTHAGTQQASKDKQAAEQSQAETTTPQDKISLSIEATDSDNQVFADAEGSGSQGRPSDEAEADDANDDAAEEPTEQQGGGLDLSA